MLELKILCSNFLEKKFELVRTLVLLTILAKLSRAPPSMLACSGSLGFARVRSGSLFNWGLAILRPQNIQANDHGFIQTGEYYDSFICSNGLCSSTICRYYIIIGLFHPNQSEVRTRTVKTTCARKTVMLFPSVWIPYLTRMDYIILSVKDCSCPLIYSCVLSWNILK